MDVRLVGCLLCLSGTALAGNTSSHLPNYNIVSLVQQGAAGVYDPLQNITWTQVKDFGGVEDVGSSHYLDVIGHTDPNDTTCPRSSGMAFDQPSIRIHETEHMLHCQIRKQAGEYNFDVEGLYYKNGRGFIFTKPKAKVTDFANGLPTELTESPSPYQTYIVEQMQYPSLNNIGYLFNEWGSYCSNITLNLELEKAGTPEADAAGHAANYSPHFFGYVAYGMHHLRTAEPAALNDKQFKAAFALYAEYTWKLMKDARNSPVFGTDTTYNGSHIAALTEFYKNSPKFAPVKASLAAIYGEDWVTKLMQ